MTIANKPERMVGICDMCKGSGKTVVVALTNVLNICGACHRGMFYEDEASSDWESLERWAASLDDCPKKERDSWRKFSRRIREKIDSGKSLKPSDIRPRPPAWTK